MILSLGIGAIIGSLMLDILVYFGALASIWFFDLWLQYDPFRGQSSKVGSPASVLAPIIFGAPLALLVLFAFVLEPATHFFRPLEPDEVCARFNQATTVEEMKQYTTLNLWPALETLSKLEAPGDPGYFEFTSQCHAPSDMGGFLVGWRGIFKEDGEYIHVDGVFYLVRRHEEWKIEDVLFTSVNHQPLPNWFSLASDYRRLFAQSQQRPLSNATSINLASDEKTSRERKQKQWYENKTTQHVAGTIGAKATQRVWRPIGRVLMAILAAIGAGIAAFWKTLWRELAGGPSSVSAKKKSQAGATGI